MIKIAIYDTHRFEKNYLLTAFQKFQVTFLDVRLNMQTAKLATGCQAVVLFVHDQADRATLQALKESGVRFIALRSAGFNHVDLSAARDLNMRVARVPEYSPYSVAEHTLALILALNRKIYRAYNRVRDLNFSLDGLVGFDIHGKTVGVVGTGRIGSQVVRILKGFGCHILATDPNPNSELSKEITYTNLGDLCARSDIITLHAPLSDATKHLIDAEMIRLMKFGVMLINTSRGGLLKTKDVIGALKSGQIGYLGLDVYEEEDALFFEDHSEEILQDDIIARLLTFPNVLITSHQAFLTENALSRIAETTAKNLECFEKNKECPNEIFS